MQLLAFLYQTIKQEQRLDDPSNVMADSYFSCFEDQSILWLVLL
jgi:hypothetical protein